MITAQMSGQLNLVAGGLLSSDTVPNDGKGTTSLNPILPPIAELVIGTLASVIVFAAIWKFAGPAIKKGMSDRTARIQAEIDSSVAARRQAETDAGEIRASLGDVDGERSRLFAEADAQAATLLDEGRLRLTKEIEDLEVKADADTAAAAGRGADDLRADISRYSSRAIESTVVSSLDDATHQELIESFIARVGATS